MPWQPTAREVMWRGLYFVQLSNLGLKAATFDDVGLCMFCGCRGVRHTSTYTESEVCRNEL